MPSRDHAPQYRPDESFGRESACRRTPVCRGEQFTTLSPYCRGCTTRLDDQDQRLLQDAVTQLKMKGTNQQAEARHKNYVRLLARLDAALGGSGGWTVAPVGGRR